MSDDKTLNYELNKANGTENAFYHISNEGNANLDKIDELIKTQEVTLKNHIDSSEVQYVQIENAEGVRISDENSRKSNETIRGVNEISRIATHNQQLIDVNIIKNEYDLSLHENTDIEIINARKGEVNLGTKIDKIVAQLENISTQTFITEKAKTVDVDNALALKTDKIYSDTNLALKRDKSTLIPLADFAQDAKTAMTGGSVAVVGIASTSLVNLVPILQDKISEFVEQVITLVVGQWVSSTGAFYADNTLARCFSFACSVGERYTLAGIFGSEAYGVLFIDTNGVILSRALQTLEGGNAVRTDTEFTIPSSTVLCKISSGYNVSTPIILKKLTTPNIASKKYVDTAIMMTDNLKDDSVTLKKVSYAKTNTTFITGTIGSTTGLDGVNTARISSNLMTFPKGSIIKTDSTKIKVGIFKYDITTGIFISSVLGGVIANSEYTATEDMMVRVVLAWANTSTVITTPNDVSQYCSIYKTPDNINYYKPSMDALKSSITSIQNGTNNKIQDGLSISSSNMVARLGYNVYDTNMPPEQSLASFALAYKNNYRTVLCDLQITSDGYYVCEHDTNLNGSLHVRNINGTTITQDIAISNLTLAQLDSNYDFGIYKDVKYAGLKILRLEEVMRLCSSLCISLVIETKVKCSKVVIEDIAKMAIKYGLQHQLIWAFDVSYDNATDAGYLLNILSTATVLWRRIYADTNVATTIISYIQQTKIAYPTARQQVTVLIDGLPNLTENVKEQLINLNVNLNFSEITDNTVLATLINGGYYWLFKSIATRIDINSYMLGYYGIS
jgi:hypothetical protein